MPAYVLRADVFKIMALSHSRSIAAVKFWGCVEKRRLGCGEEMYLQGKEHFVGAALRPWQIDAALRKRLLGMMLYVARRRERNVRMYPKTCQEAF
jgi:hypothetical protein